MEDMDMDNIDTSTSPPVPPVPPLASPNSTMRKQNTVITPLFGAVVGDIAGSKYEHFNCKEETCKIFRRKSKPTDDSILTLATARHLLDVTSSSSSYTAIYQKFGNAYPNAGYGKGFRAWLASTATNPEPYYSLGNGSAMRASPIGWVAPTLEWALEEACKSASVTHNHPSGIQGAQAVAASVYLLRHGCTKEELVAYLERTFPQYDLRRTVAEIRPHYTFDVSCDGSVPESIIAFLDSTDFETAIRKAISLGGDSDTIASIAGALAQAHYGSIPESWIAYCRKVLDAELLAVNDEFWARYDSSSSWSLAEE
jgi:ADP-ribosylglycohydrolase